MSFSDLAQYQEYVAAHAEGRLDDALTALRSCLAAPEVTADGEVESLLLRMIADRLLEGGDDAAARRALRRAESVASHASCDAKAAVAAAWLTRFSEPRMALRKAHAVLYSSAGPPLSPRQTARLVALEGRCAIVLGEATDARRALDRLLRLSTEAVAYEDAIELCGSLLDDVRAASDARRYLRLLLADALERADPADEPMRKELRRLIEREPPPGR